MKPIYYIVIAFTLITLLPLSSYAEGDYLGEKECYACHRNIKKLYLQDIHGRIFTENPRNEAEARSCEACHGPGALHKDAADKADMGEKVPLGVKFPFKKGKENSIDNNGKCLSCHEKGNHSNWQGSIHDMAGLSCIDCHTIHSKDKIDGILTCTGCHLQKRAQVQRSSHISIMDRSVKCTSCHNPHGSAGSKLLEFGSINETCYSCHAEKRGPLLWEHAPVREDCSLCHDSHGSNNPALLKMRTSYLCQSCHSAIIHPGDLYDGSDMSAKSNMLLGKGCLNCHSMIHGSNHPSGSAFTR